MQQCRRAGFTLLEQSIVLVIIGLVVGSILFGRTLIDSAQARMEVKKLAEFETAFTTFRLKYNAFPGDFNRSGVIAGVPDGDLGDGNNMLDQGFSEGFWAWEHLSKAGLIGGAYDGNPSFVIPGSCLPDISCPPTPFNQSTVHFLMGMEDFTGDILYASPFASSNLYTGLWVRGADFGSQTGNISVSQAYHVDVKIDDGIAHSGRLMGTNAWLDIGGCVDGDPTGFSSYDDGSSVTTHPYDYNLATDTADDCWIVLVIRH